jgi:flagellar biosynthesis protein FliP
MEPTRDFMLRQTGKTDLAFFIRLSNEEIAVPEEAPNRVLIPAF